MALLFFDGFDAYGVIPTSTSAAGVTADVPLQAAGYTGNGTNASLGASFTQIGRPRSTFDPTLADRACYHPIGGTRGFNASYSTPYAQLIRNVNTTGNQLIVGWKMGWPTVFSSSAKLSMIRMWFGRYAFDLVISNPTQVATTGTVYAYRLPTSVNASNVASIETTTGSTLVPVGQSNFNFNIMNTVEVMFDKTTGIVSVWINNTFVANATLTPNAAAELGCGFMFSEHCDYTAVGGNSRFPGCYTDLYVVDNTGTAPTSRLGKVKVVTRVPTADAAVSWVKPVGAATNASVAASIPPVSGNYLSGVAVGDSDLYSSGAFNFSNESIIATAVVTSGYKTDVTGNDMAALLKIGNTTYEGPKVTLPVSAAFTTAQTIFTLNPATGLKFTKAELDAANFGMRVKDPVA